MAEQRWFYRNTEQWQAIAERLKLTPCPHCKTVGALIRHGFLYGFDDASPQRKTAPRRRIFCSNRHARHGCGRTFSVWLADKIRRLSLTTTALWRLPPTRRRRRHPRRHPRLPLPSQRPHLAAHLETLPARPMRHPHRSPAAAARRPRCPPRTDPPPTSSLICRPPSPTPTVPSPPSSTPAAPSSSKPSGRLLPTANADLPRLSPSPARDPPRTLPAAAAWPGTRRLARPGPS